LQMNFVAVLSALVEYHISTMAPRCRLEGGRCPSHL